MESYKKISWVISKWFKSSNDLSFILVPNVEQCQLLKAMSFELEGYEEIVDDDLDECLAQEDEEDEAVGEKDGGHSTYDEEMENLPRKIR